MKKMKWMALLLTATMLAGCGSSEEPAQAEVKRDVQMQEGLDEQSAMREKYAPQISAYRTALTEKWDMDEYFARDMSPLAVYYYDNNGLENVGYTMLDLNNDGGQELLIGAISSADADPVLFELWTLDANQEPVKLLTSYERNRYYLQQHEEGVYMLENQGSNGAANFAHHYYTVENGALKVQQAIIFDAIADEENPWFMAYDDDWDTSNDTPIDEETAMGIIEANANMTIVPPFIPFSE